MPRLGTAILYMGGCDTRLLFNSNNCVTSATLAEVCALLSVGYEICNVQSRALQYYSADDWGEGRKGGQG